MLCLATAVSAEPRLTVELGKTQIYEGESVLYLVTLENAERPAPPKLTGFDDFQVQELGAQSSVQIINGLRTSYVSYRYALTPVRSGVLRVPAPVAEVDGASVKGRELTLEVIAPEAQDLALPTLTSDRDWVYPTQVFTVTLAVAVKALPGEFAARDPVSVQSEPPQLEIPFIDENQLPDGVKAAVDWQHWLTPFQSRTRGGFALEGVTRASPFSILDREAVLVRPSPQEIKRPDAEGKETSYWEYRFARQFVAGKVGSYAFGPVKLRGVFVKGSTSEKGLSGRNIYAIARPVTVEVRDVPLEGRPASYVGAVGTFQLTAELLPAKARVGDPMTLTLAVAGTGTLADTYAPDLALVPEIAASFKIHEATQETVGQARRFTYTIRPQTQKVTEFPAVPVSYFDVNTGRYVTLHSRPIPIEVSAAEQLSADDIVAAPRSGSDRRQAVQTSSEGIFANVIDASQIRNQAVRPGRWLLALLGLAGLYALVAVASVQIQRHGADTAGRRRRTAVSRARRCVAEAAEAFRRGAAREGADHVQDAVAGLVADVTSVPQAGLTPGDIRQQLISLGTAETLVDRVDRLLAKCDAARYGTSDAAGNLEREADSLVNQLITSLKAQKRFR